LVKKLLALNEKSQNTRVEVILLSRNSADSGLRIFNSIQHYGLSIHKAVFTNGQSTAPYASPFAAQLFLSADPADVKKALDANIAAATIIPSRSGIRQTSSDQVRIAFDGDAVLFSDESERIYREKGLEEFNTHEKNAEHTPLPFGPFSSFLMALQKLQSEFPISDSPIRTALVTARGSPAHARIIHTLREWNIRIDESMFLSGLDKGPFLHAFNADIFFDDNPTNCESACEHVATGHVPHGISNDPTAA
jgi:5'-nucleotidase